MRAAMTDEFMRPGPTDGRAEGRVADAPADNWVDRHAPPGLRPYLRLSRADRPVGTWLLLLPCWMALALAMAADPAGPRAEDMWIALGCAIGAFLMRGAGCTWNDLNDREFDAAVARTRSRPLPSGQVTPTQAWIWMCAQSLLAFGVLLTFAPTAIALGVASLAFVAVYPFAKRFTWWPQVFLGLAFNWGALLAWAAHRDALGWPALLLYLAGIAWTLFYDTIYAHQDREDDALIGVKSTARLFGRDTANWLAGFLVAAVVFAALAACLAARTPGALVLALAGVAAFGLHLVRQLRRLDIDDAGVCLAIFRSNRDAGLLLVAGFAAAALV
jgi:4-hydroxybenzoate polyprenyltransferase